MDDGIPASISRRALIQASASSLVVAQGASVAGTLVSEAAAQTGMVRTEQYILQRLSQANVKKLFGVPGATCSPLFEQAKAPLDIVPIVTSSDLAAGHAADGYARVRGLAAVAVTYGVGTMSLLPAIAGAYVERSPVVVINGGPSALDLDVQKEFGSLFSHSIGHTQSDIVMFREVTEYAVRIERKEDVPAAVDKAIVVAKTKQRPVYIEIAKHVWGQMCRAPAGQLDFTVAATGNETAIARDIIEKLRAASKPALLLGIEVQRYGLGNEVTALVNRLQIPWSSTLLGKSVIAEQTPGFVGVYSGENGLPSVTQVVEGADALFVVGCVMGRQYRRLARSSKAKIALAFNGEVRMGLGGTAPRTANLRALLAAMQSQPWTPRPALIANTKLPGLSFDQRRAAISPRAASPEAGLTYDEVIHDTSNALDATLVAVTDTSLSMYPAADMDIAGANGFICNAIWQSIGYSVGAAVGIGVAQGRRPIAICGDGGFQMTAQSLSTMVRERMNAIVIVLDNGLHSIEQWILDKRYYASPRPAPEPYLALGQWHYADLAKAMGFQFARTVSTSDEFRQALSEAKANMTGPSFIAAKIKPHDLPSGLGS
jgi:indolepyruvate decarboxylase